ncbi:MAG TPA: hypothetical protein VJZ26_15690 [Blastocatellia bacterium]|nr:hypothetical protein [Blastocatellia bacterium]
MNPQTDTAHLCEQSALKLLRYCRGEAWAGYDPYDGLNTPLARFLPVRDKYSRTALTQLIKRSPLNLRPLLGIKKSRNPKGLALAARAIILLAERGGNRLSPDLLEGAQRHSLALDDTADSFETDLRFLINKLVDLRIEKYGGSCWGYNFDWQSRAFFAPRGTPNVVCTTFAAHAFLDWHEKSGSRAALEIATGSCRFLLDRINRAREGEGHCFSYTPLDHSCVHNVNLLAGELLARCYAITGDDEYREAAQRAALYTLARQQPDGSWPYGEANSQAWIDSFHTGFAIVSLKRMIKYLGREEWGAALKSAYEYYEKRFFLADGTPSYYHNKLYPIDAHSAAQAVITFTEMTDLVPNADKMANKVVEWAIKNLQDRAGFFYYQRHRLYTIKTPHMRWAQAWMLYALSMYLSRIHVINNV